MSEDAVVSFSLEVNVKEAYTTIRELQTIFSRTLALIKQATGNEDINALITIIQKAIRITNQLRLALATLQAARMAAGDPIAWAMAGIATVEVGADVMMEATSH